MVDLNTYFGPYTDGQTDDIEMRFFPQVRYREIGTGSFESFGSSAATFSGSVSIDIAGIFQWSGDVNLSLTLGDGTDCTAVVNGTSVNGTYTTDGDYLVISARYGGDDITVKIERWEGGTYILVDNPILDLNFWIGPPGSGPKTAR